MKFWQTRATTLSAAALFFAIRAIFLLVSSQNATSSASLGSIWITYSESVLVRNEIHSCTMWCERFIATTSKVLTVLLGSYAAWAAVTMLSNSSEDFTPTITTCFLDGIASISAAQHISGTATAASFNLFSKTAYYMQRLKNYWTQYKDYIVNVRCICTRTCSPVSL